MKRSAPSSLVARAPRGPRPRTSDLLAGLTAVVMCVALVPVSAFAAVADAFEPDGDHSTASPIAVDAAAQQHTISPEGDEDWVSFSVSTGRGYVIQTAEGSPAEFTDMDLYLYDSDGLTLIDQNNADPESWYNRIDYLADADKTIYAMVRGDYAGSTGTYALSVTLVGDSYEPDGSFELATSMTVGAVAQQHSIDPDADEDWVSFQVESGYKYAVRTAPGAVPDDPNTELYLYDSDGTTLLASNHDDEAEDRGYYSRIDYTADASKTVYVKAIAWYTGTYALGVTLVGDSYEPDDSYAVATPLTVGGAPQQHTLDPGGDDDWVSFPVEAGWRYAIETAPGEQPVDPDTWLDLYDSDATTVIDSNDDHEGSYSRIEYQADVPKTVYAAVTGARTGTYAITVSRTPIMRIGVVPTTLDFGSVAVGDTVQRTIVVQNLGVAPLDVGSVQLTGAGFSIVRNEASGTAIPVGESREIDVAYTPTAAYTGAPTAVPLASSLVATYNYSGGVLVSVSLFTGFRNVGGAGNLGHRVRILGTDWTGTGAVVPGGSYTLRVVVSPGSGSTVQLLEPVAETFNVAQTGTGVLGVTYVRQPDASLSITSNDDDEPTIDIDLFGSAVPGAAPDTTPPTTSDDADALWHSSPVTVNLTAVDNEGGSGMVGGAATTQYKVDGALTWTTGTSVSIAAPTDHSNDGEHTVSYRSTDRDGNVEATKSCTVKIDTTAPTGSFALAGGAATTTSTTVGATMAVTEPHGPTTMRFSTDGKTTWSAWAAYATTTALTLPGGLGTKTVWAQVRDAAGNALELSDDIELVDGPADVTGPTVTATGVAAGGWYRTGRSIQLTATDEIGGSGVASVTYSLDGGAPRTVAGVATGLVVPVLPNARHTLVFRATDNAANSSPDRTLAFTCDSSGPATAGRYAIGRVRRLIYLRYKIGDNLSPRAQAIRIVVKNSRGRTVKTFLPASRRTATWYSVAWRPNARGIYRYYVSAKDLAGNPQRIRGSARVVVR